MAFAFLYLSEDGSCRMEIGEKGRERCRYCCLEGEYPTKRYHGTIWGNFPSWSFGTRTNFTTTTTDVTDSPIGFRVYKDGRGRVEPSSKYTAKYLPSRQEQHLLNIVL
ncbi:hypothetical protein AVEN_54190-1 [Araneus ventricosus]|uniref:Uncharacterized protein n=1 Tax=Araneus ventricosus TaxID=182803 RepID=A0A4Y2T6M8_ARAVE|nr:hypothetical protein AVEN_54190-1 [Araneus ventricosus]